MLRPDLEPPVTEASILAAMQAAQREREAVTRTTGYVVGHDGRLLLDARKAVLAVVMLSAWLSATPAVAQDRKFTLALIAYDVAGTTDVASTTYLMGRGTVREVGFAPFPNSPVAFAATKLGLLGVVNYALIGLRPKHPRLAFWIAIAGAAAETSLSVHNARLAGGR